MRAVFAATVFVIFTTPFVNAQDNRSQGFDVAQMTSEVQLAVRIEISSTGLKTLSSDIIYGAQQNAPAFEDLAVSVEDENGAEEHVTISDPRIVFDAPANKKRGTTVVFMKFSPTLRTMQITPIEDDTHEDRRAFILGGPPFGRDGKPRTCTIDLRPAVREACRRQPDICSGR